MEIIRADYRKGFVKVRVDNLDDLWYLSHILENKDLVSSYTFRKIKLGEADQKTKIIRKKVKLQIKVEKIQFTKDALRILGVITEGKEDIPAGEHHSLSIEQGTELEMQKDHPFLEYQIKKLKESSENKESDILVCVLDRENAFFALLKKYGYDLISTLKGEVQKKDFDEKKKSSFFSDIVTALREYVKRYKIKKIIIGCPNFWKTYISNEIRKTNLKEMAVYATCSADGENAIKELMKRPETKEVLKAERFSQEISLVEELLASIAKNGNVEYGFNEVQQAANLGAVDKLLVTDKIIQELREEEKYEELDSLMKVVDASKGEIHIVSSENEAGEKLDSLGGIAAFLRFRVN